MHRWTGSGAAALAMALALTLLATSPTFAGGKGKWVKFLFTPQAGYNSACLTCGWHEGGCVGQPPPGPALDFGGLCSDGGQQVYFRNFGFKPWGEHEWVGWGTPYTVDETAICKTTEVRIFDKDTTQLARMRYVHTYKTSGGSMMMYVTQGGHKNEYVFAGMVDADNPGCPGWVWLEEQEMWYWPRHLHESHVDDTSTFFLRNDGDCGATCQERYPCAPEPAPCYYDPQDWWNDWARGFCIHDTDCDGWTDDQETFMGTDPEDECADTSDPLDETGVGESPWPPDFNDTGRLDIGDLILLRTWWFGTYTPRDDLNASGDTDVGDLVLMRKKWFADNSCTVG